MPGARCAAILAAVAAVVVCAGARGQIVTPGSQVMMKPFGQEPKSLAPQKRSPSLAVDNASMDRLQQWLEALSTHTPGAQDDALERVQSWSPDELRMLWINGTALLSLMHEPAWKKIFVTIAEIHEGKLKPLALTITPEGKPSTTIRYSLMQTQRLKVMACVAGGDTFCPEILATGALPADLDHLSDLVRASKRVGDDNFVLRRGAMLHADVAIAAREAVGPVAPALSIRSSALPGPDQIEFTMFDGSPLGSREVGIQWIIARMLLDEVVPPGSKKPAPGRDDGVRDWYRATAAWMQNVESHDTQHLDRARDLFPNDPDILFLSGSQREMFAAPRIQGAVQSAALPPNLTLDVASDQKETRRAEEYHRRAIAARPDFAEAHLHLGHVLLARGAYADAAVHLRQARGALIDPLLQYYAEIMLGSAETHLSRYDAARASYGSAAAMQPTAQAPLFGLAEMERRRGDRKGTLAALERVFALPPAEPERDDPWWRYYTSQARNADELVDALRRSFASPETDRARRDD
ncbi:MAG TPA: hypothetical protein VKH42_07745 [Vicinamibacterales bacterium]|nr:hypothetical protein [Vicinamibacterales bacterium]